MIEDEITMPLTIVRPVVSRTRDTRPTVRHIREQSGLSYFEVAQRAGVRPCVVYWMEQGIAVSRLDALCILAILFRRSGWLWTLENVKGIRIRQGVPQDQSQWYQSHAPTRMK